VRDRKLIALVWLALLLSALHTGDHVVRENLGKPLTPASISSLMVSAFIYAFVGLGLYLYARGIIGPRYGSSLAASASSSACSRT